ncbi:hypothetical protein PVK06_045544 [Gossypium arboreum]|uniref:Uncharacterized protein n=1 Tax=Gossypium arboreum TaxID=29729 RepID=A0ABR0MUU9_GOSAR|nr:hypothetical protein PVK06_045544 [Gossypium arboreum]
MVAHDLQMATFCTILGLVIEFYTGDSTLQTVVWTVQSGLQFIAFNILLQRNLNKHMQEFREVRTLYLISLYMHNLCIRRQYI